MLDFIDIGLELELCFSRLSDWRIRFGVQVKVRVRFGEQMSTTVIFLEGGRCPGGRQMSDGKLSASR